MVALEVLLSSESRDVADKKRFAWDGEREHSSSSSSSRQQQQAAAAAAGSSRQQQQLQQAAGCCRCLEAQQRYFSYRAILVAIV